ncbi:MAG: hypothetical protein GXN99_01725 [Candidatus Nanohaloarchaeota archaeon]|nr:hypothetical protein [Candidatus Nanohaloarchaeota archaeon]
MISKYEIGFWILIGGVAFFLWLAHRREYYGKTKLLKEEYEKVWKKWYNWKEKKKEEQA